MAKLRLPHRSALTILWAWPILPALLSTALLSFVRVLDFRERLTLGFRGFASRCLIERSEYAI
jgi:hypothetical protein